MSNILTSWRQALQARLETSLQSGAFTVVAGERDGPSRDRLLACVFVPTIAADDRDVMVARPPMIVRAWIPKPKTPAASSPPDPEPLEQLAVDLAACLQPVQVGLVTGLYFYVASIEIDYEDWGVQATLTSWTDNPAVVA